MFVALSEREGRTVGVPALARPSLHRQELFAVMATAKWEERLQKTFPENLAIRGFYPLVLLSLLLMSLQQWRTKMIFLTRILTNYKIS